MSTAHPTSVQATAIEMHRASIHASQVETSRDEPHDDWLFAAFYADGRLLAEVVVEADGTIDA